MSDTAHKGATPTPDGAQGPPGQRASQSPERGRDPGGGLGGREDPRGLGGPALWPRPFLPADAPPSLVGCGSRMPGGRGRHTAELATASCLDQCQFISYLLTGGSSRRAAGTPPRVSATGGPVSVLAGACVRPPAAGPLPLRAAVAADLSLFPSPSLLGGPSPQAFPPWCPLLRLPPGSVLAGPGSCPRRLEGQQFTAVCRAGSGSPRLVSGPGPCRLVLFGAAP